MRKRIEAIDVRVVAIEQIARAGKLNLRTARELQEVKREKADLESRLGGAESVRQTASALDQVLEAVMENGSVDAGESETVLGALEAEEEQITAEEMSLEESGVILKAVAEMSRSLTSQIEAARESVPRDGSRMDRSSEQYKRYRSLVGKKSYLLRIMKTDPRKAKEYTDKLSNEA